MKKEEISKIIAKRDFLNYEELKLLSEFRNEHKEEIDKIKSLYEELRIAYIVAYIDGVVPRFNHNYGVFDRRNIDYPISLRIWNDDFSVVVTNIYPEMNIFQIKFDYNGD